MIDVWITIKLFTTKSFLFNDKSKHNKTQSSCFCLKKIGWDETFVPLLVLIKFDLLRCSLA